MPPQGGIASFDERRGHIASWRMSLSMLGIGLILLAGVVITVVDLLTLRPAGRPPEPA